jgi:hypothetical protein
MVRAAVLTGLLLGITGVSAAAGRSSASFTVGITIGGPQKAARVAGSAASHTWGSAAISVGRAGYTVLRRIEKTDTLYWFAAERRGAGFAVAVSIASGRVVKVKPT